MYRDYENEEIVQNTEQLVEKESGVKRSDLDSEYDITLSETDPHSSVRSHSSVDSSSTLSAQVSIDFEDVTVQSCSSDHSSKPVSRVDSASSNG